MKKTVTLRDLAKATGVHVSTVSRALDPSNRSALSEEVVKRIRDVAKDMGYRPNRLAAGLRTNRSMTVGIIIPDITNSLFPPLLRGIESVLEPSGYATIIVNTDNLPDREIRLMEVLRERGVDGIIHAAVLRDDPKVSDVASHGLPIVTVNRKIENSSIPSVTSDDAQGIHLTLQHLHEMGHRKIAHIAGPKDLSTGQIRLTAFKDAQAKLGLKASDCPISFATKFDENEGRVCAKTLLQDNPGFTAILCANDRLALGAIDHLNSVGITCPQDISVTGFNDIPFLDLIPPGLTTVQVKLFEIGEASAQVLFKLMTEPKPKVAETTVLPISLIKRESVAAPR